jgi:proteasome lid subunit RPN8/RPN11
MRISRAQLDAIVAHAREEQPNECCGVVTTRDGVAVDFHPLENLAASPLRFEVDGLALHRLLERAEDAGDALGCIYHSHTRSEAYPSQTDVNFAVGWPGVEWLIVGLAGDEPVTRSFLIDGGGVREVTLEIHDG